MINIENKTKNPITEHKVDILDRLNPNMVIGRGSQLIFKVNRYKWFKELIKNKSSYIVWRHLETNLI